MAVPENVKVRGLAKSLEEGAMATVLVDWYFSAELAAQDVMARKMARCASLTNDALLQCVVHLVRVGQMAVAAGSPDGASAGVSYRRRQEHLLSIDGRR